MGSSAAYVPRATKGLCLVAIVYPTLILAGPKEERQFFVPIPNRLRSQNSMADLMPQTCFWYLLTA